MTKHSYFRYTSTYSSTRHYTNIKHNINNIPYTYMLVRNASPRGIMCFRCLNVLICQDIVSCYFYFGLLPLGPELWCVLCYILVFCVLLCWCICLSCVLRVCELFGETMCNMFWCGCYFVVECYGCV